MAFRAILVSLLISLLLVGGIASYYAAVRDDPGLQSFRTLADFQAYVESLQQAQFGQSRGLPWTDIATFGDTTTTLPQGGEFSGTNVQVAGVDEADIVKTDGQVLYLVAGEEVVLVRATPASDLKILSRISRTDLVGEREGSYGINGLFLHGTTLAAIVGLHASSLPFEVRPAAEFLPMMTLGRTLVSLFSVVDPGAPALLETYELTGAYRASRMKDSTVYFVLHQPLRLQEKDAIYPAICKDALCESYEADRIYYDPEAQDGDSLTNVVALDLQDGEVGYLSVLTGFASTVYMSPDNLYVTFAKSNQVIVPLIGGTWESITSIYRIGVEGTRLQPAAGGTVKGWLLNQFSMDEHRGFLRVATTTWDDPQQNSVYILDQSLQVIGALEGLAPGESIYSARFVGDVGYLVTFQKVDPFFVLDLSNPRMPLVLGFLKIPGFSEYLHPMDENHILGVGKDTIEDPSGRFAWFQGLKLSLFDVTDVQNPAEVAKYLVGDRGSSSPVLYDHKAFLYIREARLVVLPVDLHGGSDVPGEEEGRDVPPWEYRDKSWQGALVLQVSPEEGFALRSRITHTPAGEAPCAYAFGPYAVTRSLYVGEYLYTISGTMVQAHSLIDFAQADALVYASPAEGRLC